MPLKVVIIGASSGLGRALAQYYASMGATLGLIARRKDLLETLAAELSSTSFYVADVRDAPAIRAAAQDFMCHHGCPDIVIANAGTSRGILTEYAEDSKVFEDILATNVIGMVNLFQPFAIPMRTSGQGSLVGIASVAGYRGLPWGAPTPLPKLLPSVTRKACEWKCMAAVYPSLPFVPAISPHR